MKLSVSRTERRGPWGVEKRQKEIRRWVGGRENWALGPGVGKLDLEKEVAEK